MVTPVRRSTDLTIQPLGDELLVFDASSDRAHSLNATAARVWEACDGTRDPDALAAHTGLSRDVVDLALATLGECHLLDGTDDVEAAPPGRSRRQLLRDAALTGAGIGIALPVIRSIAAPSAALADSTCVPYGGNACAGQSCCDQNGHRVACNGNARCSTYYSQGYAHGHACFGNNHLCRFPDTCQNGTCQ